MLVEVVGRVLGVGRVVKVVKVVKVLMMVRRKVLRITSFRHKN